MACIKHFNVYDILFFAHVPGRFSLEKTFWMCLFGVLWTTKVNKCDMHRIKRWSKLCVCLCGRYGTMLEMNEPPTTCTGFVPFMRIRHRELQALNSAVMLFRPNRPYPILWLEVVLVSCSTTWWISQMFFFKSHNCTLKWDKETAVSEFSHIYYSHRQ